MQNSSNHSLLQQQEQHSEEETATHGSIDSNTMIETNFIQNTSIPIHTRTTLSEEEENFQTMYSEAEQQFAPPNAVVMESFIEEQENKQDDAPLQNVSREHQDDIVSTTSSHNNSSSTRIKRIWKRAGQVPILKHFIGFLSTYGAIFLFNHAFRSLFFMVGLVFLNIIMI